MAERGQTRQPQPIRANRRRQLRRRAVVGALAVLALLVPGAAAASASTPPAEGIFEGCAIDTALQTCTQRLDVMHGAGIQVVVIPASGVSLNGLAQYAAAAHDLGMSVMWELSNPDWWQQPATSTQASGGFSAFASACGCSDNASLLPFIVHWLGQLPGTYGYYAADDSMIGANDQAGVTSYVAQIKRADPAHLVLLGAANTAQRHQYQSVVDLAAQEFYPESTSSLLPVSANQPTWDSIDAAAADTQQAADQAGKASAVILQAFTWGDNPGDGSAIGVCSPSDTPAACNARLRYPSGAEQLALRNAVLRNAHPKLILWWSFSDTYGYAQDPGSYYATPTPAEAASRWAGLSAAIQAPMPGAAQSATAQGAALRLSGQPTSSKKHRSHKRRARPARHHRHHKRHPLRAAHRRPAH